MVCSSATCFFCVLLTLLDAQAVDLDFQLDIFTGETGYFTVAGYIGVQPTLTLELGTTYWLNQFHPTNWMHPLGLAYQPDGAHDIHYPDADGEGAPEVADGVGTEGYDYVYYVKYPGDGTDFTAVTLDDYEPLFFLPLDQWAKYKFKIKLRLTAANVASSLVYFCHIHNKMSGKLIINGGTGPAVTNLYKPSTSDTFDSTCGTWGASSYRKQCASQQFLCGLGLQSDFAECMEAIDCKMYKDMQAMHGSSDYMTTFIHQMIPHHTNAVNMARIILKKSKTYGDGSAEVDISGELGAFDGVEDMLLDMVHGQNYQISEMRKWLLEKGKANSSDCNGRRRLLEEAYLTGPPEGLRRLPASDWASASSRRVLGGRPQKAEAQDAERRRLMAHTWEFSVDLLQGETGYFKVKGLPGVQPTLALDVGKTYTLLQKDVTNWMHPLGLAYQPDGAHDVLFPETEGEGAPEVADGVGTEGYEYVYYVKYPANTDFVAVTFG